MEGLNIKPDGIYVDGTTGGGGHSLLIAERLGHERVQTTMETYSHLYPNKQAEVAMQLDGLATKD